MVRALRAHDVVVFTREVIPSEMLPEEDECRVEIVSTELPWPWTVIRPLLRAKHRVLPAPRGHFDVYIHIRQGPLLTPLLTATVCGMNPAGGDIGSLIRDIPTVLSEAPGGELPDLTGLTHLMLPPPLIKVTSEVVPLDGLPERFLLTVFNPYEPVKGADILTRVSASAALPIIWCFSDRTVQFDQPIASQPNVVPIYDPSQALLNSLYAKASGYVSFSRREGFGWAVADALLNGLPVLTRKTGCIHFVQGQPGVTIYDSETELRSCLAVDPDNWPGGCPNGYDLSELSPDRFVARLEAWLASAQR